MNCADLPFLDHCPYCGFTPCVGDWETYESHWDDESRDPDDDESDLEDYP